jgi:hypothetical protein
VVHRRPFVSASLVLLVVSALLVGVCAPPAAADDHQVVYRPPVDAPIVDHFDPPDKPWQAGNRGVDYDVAPGSSVHAVADGEVVFSGQVGGALHVTLRHADGLRSSYSFVAEVSVRTGQRVRRGQAIAVAGGPVHLGVRAPDDTYLDPEKLFAGTLVPEVRLVPSAQDGLDPLAERRSLLDTIRNTGAAAIAHVRDHGADWLELAVHHTGELTQYSRAQRAIEAARRWLDQSRDCTPSAAPAPTPGQRRIAVVVSGLGTGSGRNSAWDIDTGSLGYAEGDVVRYSYRGGRAPGPGSPEPGAVAVRTRSADPSLDDIPVREFSGHDSQQSLEVSAERLGDLLADVAEAEPGVPIDVIAHSQGGVVSRLGVVTAGEEGRLPDTVENLVTIGSPHQGAPLATGIVGLQQTPGGNEMLAAVRASGFDPLDDRLPAIPQLSETSDVLEEMRELPIPDGVRFTSLGATGDLVVPGTATADPQADAHLLIPTGTSQAAHGDLTTLAATTREISLAIAGRPPTCQSLAEALLGFGHSELVRAAEGNIALHLTNVATQAGLTDDTLEAVGLMGE